jgi:hypothetical protein
MGVFSAVFGWTVKHRLAREAATRAIVEETYSRLSKFVAAVRSYVSESSSAPFEEMWEVAGESSHDFTGHFRAVQIRLPRDLVDDFSGIYRKFARIARGFHMRVVSRRFVNYEAWNMIADELETEAEPMFKAFEEKIRQYLGVSDGKRG